jgi:hypothetical protein
MPRWDWTSDAFTVLTLVSVIVILLLVLVVP